MAIVSACGSVTKISNENLNPPLLFVKRTEFKVTDDLTATAKVKSTHCVFFTKFEYDNKKQIRFLGLVFGDKDYMEGNFLNYYGSLSSFDEKLAVYNFIEKNNEIDYVTNIRFKKSYTRHPYIRILNLGVRETETTIVGKGIIIKKN
jgi:hypothetical protein